MTWFKGKRCKPDEGPAYISPMHPEGKFEGRIVEAKPVAYGSRTTIRLKLGSDEGEIFAYFPAEFRFRWEKNMLDWLKANGKAGWDLSETSGEVMARALVEARALVWYKVKYRLDQNAMYREDVQVCWSEGGQGSEADR